MPSTAKTAPTPTSLSLSIMGCRDSQGQNGGANQENGLFHSASPWILGLSFREQYHEHCSVN
jgi:hypothetical protein